MNPDSESKNFQFLNTSLESLNQQSEKNSYTIDDINWSLKANPDKFWMPESLVSISHLPVYNDMSDELKRLFNQYNSLGVAELFIFFEETCLAPSMEKALLIAKGEPLRIALRNFIDEENKHSACFKKLLITAKPDFYSESDFKYRFLRISTAAKLTFDLLRKFSVQLPAWVWGALFFEERTLLYSKEYMAAKKNNEKSVDELFYQAHFYHMMDEVRHVKLDEHMIKNFYNTYGARHASVVTWMVHKLIARSAYPINMIKSCLAQIKISAPQLLPAEIEQRILSEAKQLTNTKSFLDLNFSQSAAPRTRFLMSRFPEFENFWQKIMSQNKA